MNGERDGEINDNITLMHANAAYPVRRIDRSNVTPRTNGRAVVNVAAQQQIKRYDLLGLFIRLVKVKRAEDGDEA